MLTESQILDFAARSSRLSHRVLSPEAGTRAGRLGMLCSKLGCQADAVAALVSELAGEPVTATTTGATVPSEQFVPGLIVVPTACRNDHSYTIGRPAVLARHREVGSANGIRGFLDVEGNYGNYLTSERKDLRLATTAEAEEIIRVLVRVEPDRAEHIYARLRDDTALDGPPASCPPAAPAGDILTELASRAVAFTRRHLGEDAPTVELHPRAGELLELIGGIGESYVPHDVLIGIVEELTGKPLRAAGAAGRKFLVGMVVAPNGGADEENRGFITDRVPGGKCSLVAALDHAGGGCMGYGIVAAADIGECRAATLEEAVELFRGTFPYLA